MQIYRCKETFRIDSYDENGFYCDDVATIQQGDVFQREESPFRCIGGADSIRLVNDTVWLEITEEHFAEYFEEVEVRE